MAHESSWIQSFPKALGNMPWSTSYITVFSEFLFCPDHFSNFPHLFLPFHLKTPRTSLYNSLEAWIFGVWCQMPSAFLPSSKPFNNVNSFGHMHCTWLFARPWRALRWWMVSLVFWVQHSSGRGPWWSWIRWWTRRCFCWDVGGGGCKIVGWFDLCPKNWVFEGEKEFGEKRSFFGVQCENGIFSLEEGHEVDERTPRLMHQALQVENQYICQLKCDPYLEDHPI